MNPQIKIETIDEYYDRMITIHPDLKDFWENMRQEAHTK